MFVTRIITGTGVGLSTVAIPILQSETLPAHNRGALLVVQSALIIIGVAVASWLCFATLHADSSMQWRFPVACQILFSLVVLALCPWLVETPRWLAQRGRVGEARAVVARLLDRAEDDEEVHGQLGEILEGIAAEQGESEPTWREVFSNKTSTRNLHRVLLGSGPYMFNQWSVPYRAAPRRDVPWRGVPTCQTGDPVESSVGLLMRRAFGCLGSSP